MVILFNKLPKLSGAFFFYCELYIGSIVSLDATITFLIAQQWTQQLSVFLFRLLTALNLLYNNWPTWSANAAR